MFFGCCFFLNQTAVEKQFPAVLGMCPACPKISQKRVWQRKFLDKEEGKQKLL